MTVRNNSGVLLFESPLGAYSTSFENVQTLGAGSGGTTSGKAQAAPFRAELPLGRSTVELLRLAATGLLAQVEIEVCLPETTSGAKGDPAGCFHRFALTNAIVALVDYDAGPNAEAAVEFEYGQLLWTTVGEAGSLTTTFNFEANTVSPGGTAPGNLPDGLPGASPAYSLDLGSTTFDVAGLSASVQVPTTLSGGGGGIGAGKASFSEVDVTKTVGVEGQDLARRLVTGTVAEKVKYVGPEGFTVELTDVFVTKFTIDSSLDESFALLASSYRWTAAPTTFGWSAVTNSPI
jgi:hypothetical protein